MNDRQLVKLIDDAIQLDTEIAILKTKLDQAKETLVFEAQTRSDERTETAGGGSAWQHTDSVGNIVRVNFPAPTLKSYIDAEKPAGAKLMVAVNGYKDQLFTPRLTYVPVDNFRERVSQLFKPGDAKRIISQAQSASSPRVSFETKPDAR